MLRKRKIIGQYIFIYMLLLAFFKPTFTETIKYAGTVYQALLIASSCIVVLMYYLQRRLPSAFIWLLIVFRGWIVLSTLINHGALTDAVTSFLRIVVMAALVDLYSSNLNQLLGGIMFYLEAGIYINLLSLILWPDGMFSRINYAYGISREWFLGSENVYTTWIVTGLFVSWIYREFSGTRLRTWIMTVACVLTLILNGASTCIVGAAFFLMCVAFSGMKKFLSPGRMLLLSASLIILIVGFRIMGFLSPLVTLVLHKEMTFTNRVYIWDRAIEVIMEKPFLGHGTMTLIDITELLGRRYANHAHNYALQMLLLGGVPALVLAGTVFYNAAMHCAKLCKGSTIYNYCLFALFSILIMGIVEPLDGTYTYLMTALSYFAVKLMQQSAVLQKKKRIRVEVPRIRVMWEEK